MRISGLRSGLHPPSFGGVLMKLSFLSILLGLGLGSLQVYGLARPTEFTAALRRFPRSLPWGNALVSIATIWFLWNLGQENIADFAAFKKYLLLGFAETGAPCKPECATGTEAGLANSPHGVHAV